MPDGLAEWKEIVENTLKAVRIDYESHAIAVGSENKLVPVLNPWVVISLCTGDNDDFVRAAESATPSDIFLALRVVTQRVESALSSTSVNLPLMGRMLKLELLARAATAFFVDR